MFSRNYVCCNCKVEKLTSAVADNDSRLIALEPLSTHGLAVHARIISWPPTFGALPLLGQQSNALSMAHQARSQGIFFYCLCSCLNRTDRQFFISIRGMLIVSYLIRTNFLSQLFPN